MGMEKDDYQDHEWDRENPFHDDVERKQREKPGRRETWAQASLYRSREQLMSQTETIHILITHSPSYHSMCIGQALLPPLAPEFQLQLLLTGTTGVVLLLATPKLDLLFPCNSLTSSTSSPSSNVDERE